MGIERLRGRIDLIDRALLCLLNERAAIVIQICELKHRHNLAIHDPAREQQILRGMHEANTGPLDEKAIDMIFATIMSESRRPYEDT